LVFTVKRFYTVHQLQCHGITFPILPLDYVGSLEIQDYKTHLFDHLHTPLRTPNNYSAITNLHTLQIIPASTKLLTRLLYSTAITSKWLLITKILQLLALMSLLSSKYPTTELLSTVNSTTVSSILSLPYRARFNCHPSTNWVPGWRPFHTNLLVFSSQVDIQLTTELSHSPTSSFHFTQLNCTQPAWGPCYIASGQTTSKTPSFYCSACSFLQECVYQAVAYKWVA
jgi:hypothetical protein